MLRGAVFLVLLGISSALRCYHHTLDETDFKSYVDKGLQDCNEEQKYCIYLSSTTFVPREIHSNPVHRERVGCHSGNLPGDRTCHESPNAPYKTDVSMKEQNVTQRVNEVHCCRTDGCNKEEYILVGGRPETTENGRWTERLPHFVSQLFGF